MRIQPLKKDWLMPWLGIALCMSGTLAWAQPDYAPALWNPAYPGHWYTSGASHSFCVIHTMEAHYLNVISYFQQSGTQASAHYCVNSEYYDSGGGNDGRPGGEITQMVREDYWAWHALCWNKYSFGIEHEGFVNNPAWFTEAFYQASAGLVRHLCDTWAIPKDRNHIIGHNEYLNPAWVAWMATNWPQISPNCNGAQNHTDPGPYWNWTHYMELITGRPCPTITSQPASLTVAQGATATLSVGAGGEGELSYQWCFNRAFLPGATASVYTITNVQVSDAGGYSVVVSNTNGPTTSATAFISVLSPLTNPAGCILAPGGIVHWWPAEGNTIDVFAGSNGLPANGFSYAPGKVGLAFHFDGATSFLRVAGAPSIPPPWTACLWVKRQDALGTGAALMGDGYCELKLEQYNRTRKVGITQIGVGDYVFNYIAPVDTWVHLAFVGTSSGTALYANGLLQDTLPVSISLPRTCFGAGFVASSGRLIDYMLGSLDEVLLFNRALSDSEISAIYSAGSAGLCRAPEFTGTTQPGPGQFALNLKGQTGKDFTILASTNLLDWVPLATVPNPNGTAQFIDYAAGNAPRKFYRASQP